MDDILDSLRKDGDKSKAVSQLVEKGDPIVPELLSVFKENSNLNLRRGLVYAVSRLATHSQSPFIKEFLLLASREKNNAIKWFACYGLGQLGIPDTIDDIIKCLLSDSDESSPSDPNDASIDDVRRCAAEALAKFGSITIASINNLLNSENPSIVEAGCLALTRVAQNPDSTLSERKEIKNSLTELCYNSSNQIIKENATKFLELLSDE